MALRYWIYCFSLHMVAVFTGVNYSSHFLFPFLSETSGERIVNLLIDFLKRLTPVDPGRKEEKKKVSTGSKQDIRMLFRWMDPVFSLLQWTVAAQLACFPHFKLVPGQKTCHIKHQFEWEHSNKQQKRRGIRVPVFCTVCSLWSGDIFIQEESESNKTASLKGKSHPKCVYNNMFHATPWV